MTKILIVDDNPAIRQILQDHIRWMGFGTMTASNGNEGIERAIAEQPNLILMDFVMPFMNGREATQILRGNPKTQHIPVLAITALHQRSDLQRCIEAGCNDYIIKPFPVAELQKKIKALIP